VRFVSCRESGADVPAEEIHWPGLVFQRVAVRLRGVQAFPRAATGGSGQSSWPEFVVLEVYSARTRAPLGPVVTREVLSRPSSLVSAAKVPEELPTSDSKAPLERWQGGPGWRLRCGSALSWVVSAVTR